MADKVKNKKDDKGKDKKRIRRRRNENAKKKGQSSRVKEVRGAYRKRFCLFFLIFPFYSPSDINKRLLYQWN